MKSASPKKSILPTMGSLRRSPSSRRSNDIGIMQAGGSSFVSIKVTFLALTLSACSAAFAAMSTALLCIIILNGRLSGENLLQGRIQTIDAPHTRCTQDLPEHWQYGRRTITSKKEKTVVEESPGVAWLMSFPNSGTSYTIKAVRELTNTTTATNYGLEGKIKDQESVPVFKHMKDAYNGPFLELTSERFANLPKKLFLTKTHCGGTTRTFLRSCLEGRRGYFPE
eukprot:scaffold33299_cov50-Cyclotella_meneghiniana.AAC.1